MGANTVAAKAVNLEDQVGTWVIDRAHSSIDLIARHLVITKVRGHFGGFEGMIHIDENPLQSWAEATIEAASIDTGVAPRDEHLKSPDFLSVEEFPTITFKSTGLVHVSDQRFKATAELTLRGITREIELSVTFGGSAQGMAGEVIFLSAEGEIDREDFEITWNQALEAGGVLVSKKIRFEIEAQAVRQNA